MRQEHIQNSGKKIPGSSRGHEGGGGESSRCAGGCFGSLSTSAKVGFCPARHRGGCPAPVFSAGAEEGKSFSLRQPPGGGVHFDP